MLKYLQFWGFILKNCGAQNIGIDPTKKCKENLPLQMPPTDFLLFIPILVVLVQAFYDLESLNVMVEGS